MKLNSITPEDLISNHVWRYRSAGDDDSAEVETTDLTELSEDSDETFIALTAFTLCDGTSLPGYCSPSDDSGLDYLQPVIIAGRAHIRLWEGPTAESIGLLLDRPVQQIFPITFECRVPVDGRIVAGSISAQDVGSHNPPVPPDAGTRYHCS